MNGHKWPQSSPSPEYRCHIALGAVRGGHYWKSFVPSVCGPLVLKKTWGKRSKSSRSQEYRCHIAKGTVRYPSAVSQEQRVHYVGRWIGLELDGEQLDPEPEPHVDHRVQHGVRLYGAGGWDAGRVSIRSGQGKPRDQPALKKGSTVDEPWTPQKVVGITKKRAQGAADKTPVCARSPKTIVAIGEDEKTSGGICRLNSATHSSAVALWPPYLWSEKKEGGKDESA